MDAPRAQQVEQLVTHYQQLADEARRVAGEQTDGELAAAAARARRGDQLATSLAVLFQILAQRLPRVFRSTRTVGREGPHPGYELAWVHTQPRRAVEVDVDPRTAQLSWRWTLEEQATEWQTVDGMTLTDEQIHELIDLLADQRTWGDGYVPRVSFGNYEHADDEAPAAE